MNGHGNDVLQCCWAENSAESLKYTRTFWKRPVTTIEGDIREKPCRMHSKRFYKPIDPISGVQLCTPEYFTAHRFTKSITVDALRPTMAIFIILHIIDWWFLIDVQICQGKQISIDKRKKLLQCSKAHLHILIWRSSHFQLNKYQNLFYECDMLTKKESVAIYTILFLNFYLSKSKETRYFLHFTYKI